MYVDIFLQNLTIFTENRRQHTSCVTEVVGLFLKDSLEDELSTCNESVGTEVSFVDENLVFNESQRVPFFKVSTQIAAAMIRRNFIHLRCRTVNC